MSNPQQFPKLGVSACVWRDGRVLIIQRAKPPLAGIWSLPGGHVEPGETVLAAAHRELTEETGIEARLQHLAGLYDLIRRNEAGGISLHYVIACYTGLWQSGEAVAASDAMAVDWANPGEFGGMVFTPNVKEAITASRLLLNL